MRLHLDGSRAEKPPDDPHQLRGSKTLNPQHPKLMNDSASEYLNGGSNGHDGHRKAFALVPAPEDDTKRILEARWRVCTHADVQDGAARMFVLLQDGSLNPQLNFNRRGVLSVSQPVLAEWLHCGERSIRNYMRQLVAIGEVWTRYKALPHGARIIEYFLTCVRPQDEFEFARKLNDQQLWGRSAGKSAFQNDARGPKGQFVSPNPDVAPPTRPVLPVAPKAEESTETPNFAASGGKKLPSLPATDFPGRRQAVAADGGKICRQPGKAVAADGGKKRPSTAAKFCRESRQNRPALIESQNGDRDHLEKGGEPTPPADQALEDWKKSIAGPPGHPTHRSKLEKELGRIKVKLMNATGAERDFWQVRADFLRELLDGGKPPKVAAKSPAPPAKPKPAPMPFGKRKALWEKTKAEARL